MSLTCTPVRAQDPPPGTATGQKIGTAIKAAINTALPGVTDLVSLFWKKGDGDKQTKAELQTNVQAAERTLKTQAQQKVKPVAAVATELQILGQFLEPATTAHESVLLMQARSTPNKSDWDVAKAQLDRIKNIPDTEVDKVRDLWLRNALKQIKGVNNTLVIRIAGELAKPAPDKAALAIYLTQLETVLGSVTLAIGYELADLQGDLKDLSDWASGAAGAQTAAAITPSQQRFVDRINKSMNAARPKP